MKIVYNDILTIFEWHLPVSRGFAILKFLPSHSLSVSFSLCHCLSLFSYFLLYFLSFLSFLSIFSVSFLFLSFLSHPLSVIFSLFFNNPLLIPLFSLSNFFTFAFSFLTHSIFCILFLSISLYFSFSLSLSFSFTFSKISFFIVITIKDLAFSLFIFS